MASGSLLKVIGLGLVAVSLAFTVPYLSRLQSGLLSFVRDFPFSDSPLQVAFWMPSSERASFVCRPHTYRTQLISLDPLVIYIHSFLTPLEIDALLSAAEPNFAPSLVSKEYYGSDKLQTNDRTSLSAALPRDDPAVDCVLARATEFMGTMLRDEWDDIGPPQLVRYKAGQRFNVHHDWYDTPRGAKDGSKRIWNRVASFFATLEDSCTAGETHFPYIEGIAGPNPWAVEDGDEDGDKPKPAWRRHEDGGLAFRPIRGNAVFWVNLHANGSGDGRTMHAGLPLGEGQKTAMNIWPRQYRRK